MEAVSNNKIAYFFLIFSILLTIFCYLPGLADYFLLDDFESIVHNEELNLEQINTASLAQAAFSKSNQIKGRPLSMVSFALNKYYLGNNAYSFKVINLILHILNGLLVFVFSYLLILGINKRSDVEKPNIKPIWFAVIICSIWLVHPINTTGVLYVVQRMTSLAAFFCLLSMICYLLMRLRLLKIGKISIGLTILSIAFLIAATLSKENGVLVFLFITLIEIFIFQFKSKERIPDKRLIIIFSLLSAIPLIAFISWIGANPAKLAQSYEPRLFTMTERLLTELRVVSSYIQWIIVPNVQELGLYHDDIPISTNLLKPVSTILSLLFLSALASLTYFFRKSAPLVSFGIAFFFTGHLLESTIFPLELAFEHRNYLPSIGILIALLAFISYKVNFEIKCLTGAFAILILLGTTTHIRSNKWSNSLVFAEHSAINKPESPRAQLLRANTYLKLFLSGAYEDKAQVLKHLNKACETDKHSISADVSRLVAARTLGISIDNHWYNEINQTLAEYPISVASLLSLNNLLDHAKEYPDFYEKSKIDDVFEYALSKDDTFAGTKAMLLTVYGGYLSDDPNNYHYVYLLSRDALALKPKDPILMVNLANIALVLGKFDEVEDLIKQIEKANLITYSRKDVRELKENYQRVLNNS